MAPPVVTITRRLRFNAAHRVYDPALSDEENHRRFGKCANPNGHGHEYVLFVTVRGPVDPATGYVLDLSALKAVAEREVIDALDHRNLNLDVPWLAGIIPTTENLVVACWRRLASHVAPAQLVKLTLWETENHYVEYAGD